MEVQLPYIDYNGFQAALDSRFGQDIFTLVLGSGQAVQQFYLRWGDGIPQGTVDQALELAATNAANLLNQVKVRLYDEFDIYAKKLITLKTKPEFTPEEIGQASNWLQNQTNPVPTCVKYVVSLDNISAAEAAQKVVDSGASYQGFIDQVNSIKTQGQGATLDTADLVSCKNTATIYLDQLKNLKQQL